MQSPKEILEKYWGFTDFRTQQETIINSVLNKKDTIALLPTGGGKSICFQVPALILEGVCVVISPLTALMQDQVESLKSKGIKALTIPSKTTQDEIVALFDNLKFGSYKFLYISPERLQSTFIQQKIKELKVALFAIDEAHCISEWGHDFRPSYRTLKVLKNIQPNTNTIALTATANNKVIIDIAKNLVLIHPKIVKQSFRREKLAYQIFTVEDKLHRLLEIFKKTQKPAIIYTNSRKGTEDISNFLNANNFKSSFYHAGLPSNIKKIAFDNWMLEKTPIMVATNAFGMGIDKPNVGIVVHLNVPSSIENYIQEAGRAGRNGKKAFSVVLQNENDIRLFKQRLTNGLPSLKEMNTVYKKLFQHFQIAYGEFVETSFEFNFINFCKKYKFNTAKVTNILKLLTNQEIIQITTDFNKKSTVYFKASSKQVLNYGRQNKKMHEFISVILRSYAGIFEQETKIDEFYLAKKTGITHSLVKQNLSLLEKEGLLVYKVATSNAAISFLHPREDDKTIHRNSKEIVQFLKQKQKKAQDLIAFIKNDKVCRSIQLLRYFDEKNLTNCEICDVCLTSKKNKHNIKEEIFKILQENKELSSLEICGFIHANEKDILIHLQTLLSEKKVGISHSNKFYLK